MCNFAFFMFLYKHRMMFTSNEKLSGIRIFCCLVLSFFCGSLLSLLQSLAPKFFSKKRELF
uniref:Uncharacterized protein n=1 Tax=Ascaris lumbricoides TaxID=6252 RepID=A0A0M3ID68_ASCLU